jgi:ArsR family transcriptional regulator
MANALSSRPREQRSGRDATRSGHDVERVAERLQLLGHPIRLRMLHLLGHAGELCVGDLCDILRLPQSTASRHLALLRAGGLVAVRQVGLWVYYRRAAVRDPLAECAERSLSALPGARQDVRRLEQLRREGGCCSPVVDPGIIFVPALVPRRRPRRYAPATASSRRKG